MTEKQYNRQEIHKFLDKLIDGESAEEAIATLKEILIDYFAFNSSIDLKELVEILANISQDYSQESPSIQTSDDERISSLEERVSKLEEHSKTRSKEHLETFSKIRLRDIKRIDVKRNNL